MSHSNPTYDAIVVGAGVSGTASAILLAKSGLSVLLVDCKRDMAEYKSLCTHFVQPVANSIFRDVMAEDLLGSEYSVATQARFHVPGGVIDTAQGYGADAVHSCAHNLERRVMDPFLRRVAREVGCEISLGTRVSAITCASDGVTLDVVGQRTGSIKAKYCIAADGRMSDIAKLSAAPADLSPNDRFAYFVYGRGLPAPDQNRSLFVLNNAEMSFLYPLIQERTLLSVYVTYDRFRAWGNGRTAGVHLIDQFRRHLPDIAFDDFVPETPVMGYKRYPNQLRPPVHQGIAFVGDAALSLDPMSGVGCSFGLKSARLLADAIADHGSDTEAALAQYAQSHASFFLPHATGIIADARVAKSDGASEKIYATIMQDDRLKKRYLDLTGRMITPSQFQKSYLMAAAKQAAAARTKSLEAVG